jgi:hypothetical protein
LERSGIDLCKVNPVKLIAINSMETGDVVVSFDKTIID